MWHKYLRDYLRRSKSTGLHCAGVIVHELAMPSATLVGIALKYIISFTEIVKPLLVFDMELECYILRDNTDHINEVIHFLLYMAETIIEKDISSVAAICCYLINQI